QVRLVYSGGPNGTQIKSPVVWSGSGASTTVLHRGGFNSAEVQGSGGGKFAGTGVIAAGPVSHAMVWNSLAAEPIDLNPTKLAGFTHSSANATSGVQQVGSGRLT